MEVSHETVIAEYQLKVLELTHELIMLKAAIKESQAAAEVPEESK